MPSGRNPEHLSQKKRPPAVAIKNFSGSGPHAFLGASLSAMLLTDMSNDEIGSKLIFVEWERRALIERELELSNSPYFDPTTRVRPGQRIEPDVFVTGTVSTTETDASWKIDLVNAKTAAVIGHDSGKAKGEAILDEAPLDIAKRLAAQISKWWSEK